MSALNKPAFARMRQEMERFDRLREDLIKKSRDVLKQSKGAIYSIHRNEMAQAKKQLASANGVIRTLNKLIAKDSRLATVGALGEALEEFVEASCYYGFITTRKLPTDKELGVESTIYLAGVCDLIGELVRKAVNSVIKQDYKTAREIRDFVNAVHQELMLFDFRNIPVRRKFDSIKYGLEKLEDLMLQIQMRGR